MKINLGGGYKRYDGFLNVDNDPLTKPDILVNLETGTIPIDDNSVEEVRAYHILEHIGEGFFKLMQELYRVCKDGAIIDIHVPHHRSETFYGDPSHVRFITLESLRQFSKKFNQWHIDTWNSSSGFGIKLDVDFEIIEYEMTVNQRWEQRFKDMSQQEIEEVSANFNNVYDEFWVKLQVIKDEH
jgi:ubiquinone/menaquinone biosynthesis C-methylase UbiE